MKRPSLGCADALIVVDLQVDFCPGGALPVPEGDKVAPVLNRWLATARKSAAMIVATRDWHPVNHLSFQAQGGPWPTHCVQNSRGASFHAGLDLPPQTQIVSKGTAAGHQGYSAFEGTCLARKLNRAGVKRVWIGGLALDYCVRATALDAIQAGFEVHLIKPATRAVNLRRGDGQRALCELKIAGCIIEDGDLHAARR